MATNNSTITLARLLALHQAQSAGLLEGKTLEEIGNKLGVNRSTIMRDLRKIKTLEGQADLYFQQITKGETNASETAILHAE